jgi:hypothetical protein
MVVPNKYIFNGANVSLNAICPYFAMFPLSFPYSVLSSRAKRGAWLIDPFCGRGTTNFAGRILGLPSIGVDSNPVAIALTTSKMTNSTPGQIVAAAKQILEEVETPKHVPMGEYWEWAFHRSVLLEICRIREGLLKDCSSDSRKALLGIVLGALHGPLAKGKPSYFSNQCIRTFSPKPGYSVKFWKDRGLLPRRVDLLEIIKDRANRYYSANLPHGHGMAIVGDSTDMDVFTGFGMRKRIKWIVTSPPYFGMNTYIQDQWLRNWFVGGEPKVNYSNSKQIRTEDPQEFALELHKVWRNIGLISAPGARMVIRFGSLNTRKGHPKEIIASSFRQSDWRIQTIITAGAASKGRRQASYFASSVSEAKEEIDVWARWQN